MAISPSSRARKVPEHRVHVRTVLEQRLSAQQRGEGRRIAEQGTDGPIRHSPELPRCLSLHTVDLIVPLDQHRLQQVEPLRRGPAAFGVQAAAVEDPSVTDDLGPPPRAHAARLLGVLRGLAADQRERGPHGVGRTARTSGTLDRRGEAQRAELPAQLGELVLAQLDGVRVLPCADGVLAALPHPAACLGRVPACRQSPSDRDAQGRHDVVPPVCGHALREVGIGDLRGTNGVERHRAPGQLQHDRRRDQPLGVDVGDVLQRSRPPAGKRQPVGRVAAGQRQHHLDQANAVQRPGRRHPVGPPVGRRRRGPGGPVRRDDCGVQLVADCQQPRANQLQRADDLGGRPVRKIRHRQLGHHVVGDVGVERGEQAVDRQLL